jgi:hypothetical protein
MTDADEADSAGAFAAPSLAAALAPPLVPITYKPTLRELGTFARTADFLVCC